MQTTLLGVAIVIILALVAALAGPLFIRLVPVPCADRDACGAVDRAPVRIAGRIDASAAYPDRDAA